MRCLIINILFFFFFYNFVHRLRNCQLPLVPGHSGTSDSLVMNDVHIIEHQLHFKNEEIKLFYAVWQLSHQM